MNFAALLNGTANEKDEACSENDGRRVHFDRLRVAAQRCCACDRPRQDQPEQGACKDETHKEARAQKNRTWKEPSDAR